MEQIKKFMQASGEQLIINRKMQYDKWLWSYLQNQIYYEIQNLKENNPPFKIQEDVKEKNLNQNCGKHYTRGV